VAKLRGIKKLLVVLSSAFIVLGLLAEGASADQLSDEDRFLQLINAERAANGRPGLAMDGALRELARAHSATMAGAGHIFHNSNLGAQAPAGWRALGENVGMGGAVDGLHIAFMNSPGHRANVLGDFDKAGIGIAMSGSTMFVTEIFWKSASVPAAAVAAAKSKMKCKKVGRRVTCRSVGKRAHSKVRARSKARVKSRVNSRSRRR
jgi:uncharacterized protein YkwD